MRAKMKSIKTRYLLTGFILCILSLIPISLFSYLVAHHITVDLSNKMIKEKVICTANEIDYWFKSRQNMLDALAQDIEIYEDFSDKKLHELLESKIVQYEDSTLDFYVGFADTNRTMVNAIEWDIPDDYNPTQRTWYQQAIQTDQVIFTDPYVDAMTGELVITIAKALRYKGEIVGVLGSDIYLSEIMKVVDLAKINNNSYGMLLDDKGRIIAHPNSDFLPTDKGLKEIDEIEWKEYQNLVDTLLVKEKLDNVAVRGYLGGKEVFNFKRISSNNWYLGISVDQSEYQEPLKELLIGFVSSIFVSMLLAFFIMVKLIKSMIRPIKSLNDAVRAFSADTGIRAQISSEDEIGELGRNFNEMADTIQEYGLSLERKVVERTKELQQKNNTIMESIEYARRLQNAIIPDISKKLCILRENCFAVWKPRDIVGGDMFWCKGDVHYGLLVFADCTGHGVPGALMSMALNSILDTSLKELQYHDPAMLMHTIHKSLIEVLGQNEADSEINDGADIGILYLDKINKKLVFSGAKMNLFIALPEKIQLIKGSRDSVGYNRNKEVNYHNIELPYNDGIICYLSTDGFLDQNKKMNTGGIGWRGFLSFISEIHQLPMQKQKDIFEADIEEKLQCVPQRDDITIIGLKL